MGSTRYYPDEGPVHRRSVDAFEIDRHPVTNRQFARFVESTGYVTVAERPLDPAAFPSLAPEQLAPSAALVFKQAPGPVNLGWRKWWAWVPGASWRTPEGPGSSIEERLDHPVVQVAFADATAYAHWAGKALPTEVEFEYAARGALDAAPFAWGQDERPGGQLMANTWQGRFPVREPWRQRLGRHVAGGVLPTERLRAVRHDRQRLGVDDDPVCIPPRGAGAVLLRPIDQRATGPRAAGAGWFGRAAGPQRRLAPVRTRVLPQIPAGRPVPRGRGHLHNAHRLPLRPPNLAATPPRYPGQVGARPDGLSADLTAGSGFFGSWGRR